MLAATKGKKTSNAHMEEGYENREKIKRAMSRDNFCACCVFRGDLKKAFSKKKLTVPRNSSPTIPCSQRTRSTSLNARRLSSALHFYWCSAQNLSLHCHVICCKTTCSTAPCGGLSIHLCSDLPNQFSRIYRSWAQEV